MSDSQLPLETSPDAKNIGGALVPIPVFPHPLPRPEAAPPTALSGMPNVLALLKALKRRLLPALLVGLLVAAAVGSAIWFLLPPPKNTARVQLYASGPNYLLNRPDGALSGEAFLRNQAYIIKDRFVLNAALNAPEVVSSNLKVLEDQTDQLQWLETELKVEFPGPEFIQISMSGDHASELLTIVKAVRKAYLEKTGDKELADRENALKMLKDIQIEWEKRSKTNRKRLRDLQLESGAIDMNNLALVQKIAFEELASVQKDLVKARSEIRRLRVEIGLKPEWREAYWPRYLEVLNTTPASVSPLNFPAVCLLFDEFLISGRRFGEDMLDQLARDPIVKDDIKEINKLEAWIEGYRRTAKPEKLEKLIKPLQEKLDTLRHHVEEYAKRKAKRDLENQGTTKISPGASIRERYAAALSLERVLSETVKELDEQTGRKNRVAVDLADVKDEITKAEDIMNRASKKIDAIEIETKAPPRVKEFGDGSVYIPDAGKRKLLFAASAAGGALVFVLLAFAWMEFQTRKVHTPEEVVQGLGLPLVGTVPDLSQNNWMRWLRPNSGDSAYTQSLLAESVDTARTLLLHAARTEKLQIVMVTSALAGEGKTSLASHLAASLARAGKRTLMLDSDLRNPSLHRLFDMTRGPGLSEVLRGDTDLTGAIRETPIPSLWLISAGQSDPVALQTLALDNMQQIFEQLRPQYEFILVDSCPVLPVADSLLVGQHVDAVIFSLLREISRMPRVYAAYQRLAMLGVRILGAVVNGAQQDRYGGTGYNYRYVSTED